MGPKESGFSLPASVGNFNAQKGDTFFRGSTHTDHLNESTSHLLEQLGLDNCCENGDRMTNSVDFNRLTIRGTCSKYRKKQFVTPHSSDSHIVHQADHALARSCWTSFAEDYSAFCHGATGNMNDKDNILMLVHFSIHLPVRHEYTINSIKHHRSSLLPNEMSLILLYSRLISWMVAAPVTSEVACTSAT